MAGRRQSQPYVTRNQHRAAALRRQNTMGNFHHDTNRLSASVKVKVNIQTVLASDLTCFTEF